jgi:PIN domain nuclease of toxin-antitoxin system
LNLLLDTHIWLWSLEDHKRLGKRVLAELRNPGNQIWLSPISTWEILTLNARGRVRLPVDFGAWVTQATAQLLEAPLTHEIAVAARRLPWSHKDPADRFLAATAQILHLTLVTADVKLLGLGDISTLANR